MAATSTAAETGYRLFVESDGGLTRSDLADALGARGLPAVSQRMVAHYKALYDRGIREYVSINEFDVRRKREQRRLKTVFVGATLGYDLRPVSLALLERGLELATFQSVSASDSAANSLRRQIDAADAYIAFIGSEEFGAVVFELGIAVGLEKPVLLAVDRHLGGVLEDFYWLPKVVLDTGRHEPVFAALDRLRERPDAARGQKTVPTPAKADLAKFGAAWAEASALEFESLVAGLMSECGGEVHGRSVGGDQGFDFTVWAPRLEPLVPNPLLVEVKLRLPPTPAVAIRQALTFLGRSGGTGVALLVYRDGPPSDQLGRTFPVLPIRFDELLSELKERDIGQLVIRRRNLAVHSLAT